MKDPKLNQKIEALNAKSKPHKPVIEGMLVGFKPKSQKKKLSPGKSQSKSERKSLAELTAREMGKNLRRNVVAQKLNPKYKAPI